MCRVTISGHKAHFVEQGDWVIPDQDSRGEEVPLLNIHMVKPCCQYWLHCGSLIGEKVLAMELDSGVSVYHI